ncbi:MAG: hypothetical protein AAF483_12130 [Planctomycetota bacterium]
MQFPSDSHPPVVGQKPSGGSGCLKAFIIVLVLGLLSCAGIVGGLYYSVFHSSMPLAMMEDLLESSGDVKIEGLSGSISSGFHMDEMSFRGQDGNWSMLRGIDFEFESLSQLTNEQRLIIDHFTVDGGEIYYSGDDAPNISVEQETEEMVVHSPGSEGADADDPESEVSDSGDFDLEGSDLAGDGEKNTGAGLDEMVVNGSNVSGASNDVFADMGLKEVKIGLVQVSNLKLIHSGTNEESDLGRIAFKDFHYLDGETKSVGELEVEGITIHEENIELENFAGSTNAGFSIEQFRWLDEHDNWSHLKNIQFVFNGAEDLIANKRLRVNRISIDDGEIFVEDFDSIASPDIDLMDAASMDSGAGSDLEELESVQFDLISLPNLKIINSATGIEFNVNEIELTDMRWQKGEVTSFGKIHVDADHIEIQSNPSKRFSSDAGNQFTMNWTGSIGSALHENVKQDINFDFDVAIGAKGETRIFGSAFQNLVQFEPLNESTTRVSFSEFSPTEFFAWTTFMPSRIDGVLEIEEKDGKETVRIAEELAFNIGLTRFAAAVGTDSREAKNGAKVLRASSSSGKLICDIYLNDANPHYVFEVFEQGRKDKNSDVLLAQVLFGKAFDELVAEEKARIKMIQK